MRSLSGQTDFFGLDLGVTAVRVVELKGKGPVKTLGAYGSAPFQGTMAVSDSKVDQHNVGMIVSKLVRDLGITTKNVAVNLPANRVFTTVVDMDKMPADELDKTIKYQADSFIPTPLAESKMDWAVIGDSPKEAGKMEVLLSSVANDYIEQRLNFIESLGFNVVAFEPDSMALARALVAPDATTPQMILDIGSAATDLIITINGVPHLSRAIPTGLSAIFQSATQNLAIDPQQAQQFVLKFGLGKDKLEGQVYNAIIGVVEGLAAEIEKSIKFFQGRYTTLRLDRIIVTGGASALPEFPLYLANRFGISVEIGNAWRNVSAPPEKQNELAALSNHFGVAVGLAERENE